MDISELKRAGLTKNINRHPWEIARGRIIRFLLTKHQVHSKHIADIGSGDAFVLKTLAKTGLAQNYSAVDIAYTPEIIQELASGDNTSKISFYNDFSLLFDIAIKADTLLLMDVLEHCKDDKSVLKSVVESGSPADKALFLITAPAFQSLFSSHDKLLLHYRRYTRKQLINLCRTTKLEVVKSGYFFNILIPIRVIQLLLEKLKLHKATSSLDNWKGNKMITKLFYAILWADFRASYLLSKIGLHIPGLSCYCICRKLPS